MANNLETIIKVEKLNTDLITRKFGTTKAADRLKVVKEQQKESILTKKVDWVYLDKFKFTI